MKAADEWQELTNILSNLIAKYACVLSGMSVHQQEDKPELRPDETTMPKGAIAYPKTASYNFRCITCLNLLRRKSKNSAEGDWRRR